MPNNYPNAGEIRRLAELIDVTSMQKHEYGAKGIDEEIAEIESQLSAALGRIKNLPVDSELKSLEPDALAQIRSLCPEGPRKLLAGLPEDYDDRLKGAMFARFAGVLLGSVVEGMSVEAMEEFAAATGDEFPPAKYWSKARSPFNRKYFVCREYEYAGSGMTYVAADDDIIYVIVALMILEKYGADFTAAQVGDFWHGYLPWVWLDMGYALSRYVNENVGAEHAADDNPYGQLLCSFIRIDGYAWCVPGQPEKAAELAYKDAYFSHRRNGLYGAMFFAAAEAAAFAVNDPLDAVKIGLSEIPENCGLAKYVRMALNENGRVKNYREARAWLDRHLGGMSINHTINNACAAVMGLMIGGTDVSRVISETVAIGLDNDCTAGSAGSIAGGVAGAANIPERWTKPFNNTIRTYIKGHEYVYIDDLLRRFKNQANRLASIITDITETETERG